MRGVVAQSPLPMIATQGRAHVVKYVNPAFCGLVGHPARAIIGKTLDALAGEAPQVPHDDTRRTRSRLHHGYGRIRRRPRPPVRPPLRGPPVVHCLADPLGLHNRPNGLLVLASAPESEVEADRIDLATARELRDVNQRLLIAGLKAQELAEMEITLRDSAEAALKVRDQFMAIAAHELAPRSPVSKSAPSSRFARWAGPPRTTIAVEHYLLGIVRGADRLAVLMQDLMDVSRMRSGGLVLSVKLIDFARLVSAVEPHYAETEIQNHRLVLDVPVGPLMVAGDAGRLEQVMDNLLGNAVKYSPDGGDILVKLREADDGFVLTVSDTGIGVPPGAEDSIFEPFGRAANASQQGLPGLGLGLHICRQIVEAHGGRMWAQSTGEGQGMTVGVWLPAA